MESRINFGLVHFLPTVGIEQLVLNQCLYRSNSLNLLLNHITVCIPSSLCCICISIFLVALYSENLMLQGRLLCGFSLPPGMCCFVCLRVSVQNAANVTSLHLKFIWSINGWGKVPIL